MGNGFDDIGHRRNFDLGTLAVSQQDYIVTIGDNDRPLIREQFLARLGVRGVETAVQFDERVRAYRERACIGCDAIGSLLPWQLASEQHESQPYWYDPRAERTGSGIGIH